MLQLDECIEYEQYILNEYSYHLTNTLLSFKVESNVTDTLVRSFSVDTVAVCPASIKVFFSTLINVLKTKTKKSSSLVMYTVGL